MVAAYCMYFQYFVWLVKLLGQVFCSGVVVAHQHASVLMADPCQLKEGENFGQA